MNPLSSVPARQIYLEDAISRHKTGVSPIRSRQKVARRYEHLNNAFNASLFAAFLSCYFAYNKTYTGRNVYLLSLAGSAVVASALFYYSTNYRNYTRESLGCEEKNFNDYVHFYRYANIDPINYFEEDARKQ